MKPAAKALSSNHKNPFGELNLRLNPASAAPSEDEPMRTLIVGNLEDRIGEELLYELFLQVGPLSGIRMPRDKLSHRPTGMAFVVFRHPVSVDFAIRLLSGIRLYGRELVLTKMSANPIPRQPIPSRSDQIPQGGSVDRGCPASRGHFMYQQQTPRPLMMAPPPPLFLSKSPFDNSPVPFFRPPYHAPYSDPGYSHGDYRSQADHRGEYAYNRSRNEIDSRNHSYRQSSDDYTPTRRPVPYTRPSAHSRGSDWH